MDDHDEDQRRLTSVMTAERLRPHLEGWLAAGGLGRTFVVHLDGVWSGSELLIVGDQYVDVHVCSSELAVREELARPRPEGRTVVLLTEAEVQGADVLARVAKRRVLRLHAWDAVQSMFGVRQIDPLILGEKWMAEALVEAAPLGGYEKTAAQALDADRAWRALLRQRHGIDADAGLDGLLTWAASSDTGRLSDRADVEYHSVRRRLVTTMPGAEPVLAAVAAGEGTSAIALGLVARVLVDSPAGEARATARTLLSVTLGGWTFDKREVRAWANAAEKRVNDLLARDLPAGQATLQAADRLVPVLHAEPLVGISDLLAAGLRVRLSELGSALARRREGAAVPGTIERATERVRGHRVQDHHAIAVMSMRLTRWLDVQTIEPENLRDAAAAHAADGSYVDWARTALRVATGEPTLDEELRALVAEADGRRRDEDVRFAALLAPHVGHAASGGPILGVEEILDRVVAPVAAGRPLLFVVLDGMSHRVASELIEDVVARGWTELRPTGQHGRTLVLAALPSVTKFSRASLLSGSLVKGTATDEAKAFAAHPGLVTISTRGHAPKLFHKGSLKDPHGGLASDVRSQLASDRRVIGVVINAIDDHLARSDQLAAPWDTSYIPLLRLLLDEARDAGRMVVLASDHGHVLDHGGASRSGGPDHGERWRSAVTAPDVGEQLVEGERVLAPGGSCILAVDEALRYISRKHGYHGGGSPQEVLCPLLVLAPGLADSIDGWTETAYDPPAWWTGQQVDVSLEPVRPSVINAPIETEGGQLTLGEPQEELPAPRSAATRGWLAELLASELFADGLSAASRARVPQERVVAILAALDEAGGQLLKDALARRIGVPPLRLRGMLATISPILNVDGYPVLTVSEDTDHVVLDLPLLRAQFGLASP